jgi:hypothetical protein
VKGFHHITKLPGGVSACIVPVGRKEVQGHVTPVVPFLGIKLMNGQKLDNRDPELLEVRDLFDKTGKSSPLLRADSRIGPGGKPLDVEFVDDEIMTVTRARVRIPGERLLNSRETPQRCHPIRWLGLFGGFAAETGRKEDGASERVQEHFASVEAVPLGWVVRAVNPVPVKSCSAQLFFRHQAVPYQAGLVKNGVKCIFMDRFDEIIFGIEKKGYASGVPREEGKIKAPLRFDPGRSQGPWRTLNFFPLIDNLKGAISFQHGSTDCSDYSCLLNDPFPFSIDTKEGTLLDEILRRTEWN